MSSLTEVASDNAVTLVTKNGKNDNNNTVWETMQSKKRKALGRCFSWE
jgi:hypothetical protein